MLIEEVEAEEKAPAEKLKLEATMKRYTFSNKTVRRIHISERFNDKDKVERYDKATESGQRYCIVTIELLPKSNLRAPKED